MFAIQARPRLLARLAVFSRLRPSRVPAADATEARPLPSPSPGGLLALHVSTAAPWLQQRASPLLSSPRADRDVVRFVPHYCAEGAEGGTIDRSTGLHNTVNLNLRLVVGGSDSRDGGGSQAAAAAAASNWNVANAVTVGRIVAAPVLAYCIAAESYDAALGVLLFAGASDWADGQLARRLRLHTTLGSYLDPLADKLLVSCATVSLAHNGVLSPWLAALIVSRDAVLLAGGAALLLRPKRAAAAEERGGRPCFSVVSAARTIEPLFVSKVNTALQISLAVTAVVAASDYDLVSMSTVAMLGNGTAVTTVTSGFMYARAFSLMR